MKKGRVPVSATALLASALLAQSAFAIVQENNSEDRADVGYEELANGNPRAAIESIESNRNLESDDPAALINLGNAYARLGKTDKALNYYRAAIASDTRYELELADGSWMDSREAARKALKALMQNTVQAMRE
jgi:tetratricopeptide (TPR) repeat protein